MSRTEQTIFQQSEARGDVSMTRRRVHFVSATLPQSISSSLAAFALIAIVTTWLFGTIAAALFIAATAALIVITPRAAGREFLHFWPLLLLPLLALFSTIWSDAPVRTLRAALQLLITCVAAIIICRRIGSSSMILALFIGFLGLIMLILPGVPHALSSNTPLGSSMLGSKNQVGSASHLLIALSLAVVVDKRQPGLARLITLPAFALGLLVLVLSQSAGSTSSLLITLLTFPAFVIFGRIPMSMRIAVLLIALLLVAVAFAFLPDLQAMWADFRGNVLKKDATLTGRTYLWDVAARLNAERPWLGRGYYAFWRRGNIDAEGLWRWGDIAARRGFNFHNAFIEMQVDLGWVGEGLFIITSGAIAIIGFVRQLTRPSVPMAFLLSLAVVVNIRSYAESGLIAPFSLSTLLWLATAIYAWDAPAAKDGDRPVGRTAGMRSPRSQLRKCRRG
jgi:exopolysaccharide production protein ExoQ